MSLNPLNERLLNMATVNTTTCFLMSNNDPRQKRHSLPPNQPRYDNENGLSSEHKTKKKYGHTTADVESQILDWLEETKGDKNMSLIKTRFEAHLR